MPPNLKVSGTLSPAQVASKVGVDEKTVRNWIHAHVVEAFRTPAGRYRLSPAVVPILQELGQEMPLNVGALRRRFQQVQEGQEPPTS